MVPCAGPARDGVTANRGGRSAESRPMQAGGAATIAGMPSELLDYIPSVGVSRLFALAAAVAFVVVCVWGGVYVKRSAAFGRLAAARARRLHVAATNEVAPRMLAGAESAGRVAANGERLSERIRATRATVLDAHWLAGEIPRTREELRTALFDLILPGHADDAPRRRRRTAAR